MFLLVDANKRQAFSPHDVFGPQMQRALRGASGYMLSAEAKALQAVCVYPDLHRAQVLGTVEELMVAQSPMRHLLAASLMSVPVGPAQTMKEDLSLLKCALSSAAFGLGILVDRDEEVARSFAFLAQPVKRERAFFMAAMASIFYGDDDVLNYCLRNGGDPFLTWAHEGISVFDVVANSGDLAGLKMLISLARDRIDVASLWALRTHPALHDDTELMVILEERIDFLCHARQTPH